MLKWNSMREGNAVATNAALLLFGLIAIEFCRTGVGEFHHFVHGFSETIFAQIAVYLGAISLIERCPTNKWTLRIIFAVALIARLICVMAPPFLSTDIYRYVWDGKVQGAAINPFRYIPADAHLAFLRDASIYPHINRADYAHTIYPPGAQIIFLAITRLAANVTFMKLVFVGFEAVTCLVLLRIFRHLRMPVERVVLYAWHPLCFWEIASSGHADAAAVTFLTLAMYARMKQQPGRAGLWLGAATLVKLYPAALLPAFFERSRWRMPALFAAVVAAGYACYSSVGLGVFGFLSGYAQEEGLATGDRYFLLTWVNRTLQTRIPPIVYVAICGVVMAGLCLWALSRGSGRYAFVFSGLVIATMLNVFYTPHYPWYFLWLLPYVAIVPWRPAFYLVTASTYLFATNLGAPGEPMFHLNILLYAGFASMLAYDLSTRLLDRKLHHPRQEPTDSPAIIISTVNAGNS